MEENGLLRPKRLLTGHSHFFPNGDSKDSQYIRIQGYIPNAETLETVSVLAKKLRRNNRDLIYLLDRAFGSMFGITIF